MRFVAATGKINDLVACAAAEYPDRPVVHDGDRLISYSEMAAGIEQLAQALSSSGVNPGDRVLVIAENCAEQVTCLFACARIDAWPVMVSARLAAAEIDRILQHCGPRMMVLLTAQSTAAMAHAQRLDAMSATLNGVGPCHTLTFNDAVAEPVHADPAQRVAAMIYTSGSTGTPKGAMLSHSNLVFMGLSQARVRSYTPKDKVYCVIPIAHIGGLASVVMGMTASGGCMHLHKRFTPPELAKALREQEVTIVSGVPTLYVKFLEWVAANPDKYSAPHLRLITCASSPLDPAVKRSVESMFNLPLMNGYGMTESSAVICQTNLDEWRDDVSVGPVLDGVSLRIVDEAGQDVQCGQVGELVIQGPTVFLGYYRNESATRDGFIDGWFRTGDLGYMDDNGDVFIAGRAKDTIKRSGYNVYPVDVETALNAHQAIAISAVVGRFTGVDEEVIAYVQPIPDATLTDADVVTFLREKLAPYKLPNRIIFLKSLPTLHNGKVDRNAIKAQAQSLQG
ncbi:MAG: acyl--CoA ligase [Gammaproteobacteria bacterium]|nr:acyl--CoA ligase [Gammaproteobacteria bacterium]